MKRRKTQEDDGSSLDSLLDTMTNVVGILVIVLVVTQLGVDSAVNKIKKTISETIDAAAVKMADDQLAAATATRDALQADLAALRPNSAEFAKQLNKLAMQQDAQKKMLRELEEARKRAVAKAKDAEKMALEIRAKNEANERQANKIKGDITGAQDKRQMLQAVLAKTPERRQLPPKQVYLPNPRPAPAGIKPIYFLCANNRVYFLDIEGAREAARKRADLVVQRKGLNRDLVKGIDPDRFVEEFHKLTPLRDATKSIEVKMAVSGGRYPRLVLHPLENAGFSIKEVEGIRSRFRSLMTKTDRTKYYASFFVLPDSFEAYVAARKVAIDVKLLAGWTPQNADYKYTTSLGGPLRLGPPMEDPKPKPPNPNAKPAKPPNVID